MIKIKVTPDDGEPFVVVAASRDVATWERTNKGASLQLLQSEPKMDDIYKITHIAAVRQQLFTGTLAEMRNNADIKQLDDDDEDTESGSVGDPTQSAA